MLRRAAGAAARLGSRRHLTTSTARGGTKPYDVVVIGGGSGGIACARESASLGARVAVLDAVSPSPQGTSWGLGGTCVNVGCIPKKLMHRAARLGDAFGVLGSALGWPSVPDKAPAHDWPTLSRSVTSYVRSLNFGYRSALQKEGVDYINAFGQLGPCADDGSLVVACTAPTDESDSDAEEPLPDLVASSVVVATGTRPVLPSEDDLPGVSSLAITSDDLFSLRESPGRVLVVGGGYIALECAGFLRGLGLPVTVVHRSDRFLRAFDSDASRAVVQDLTARGVQFRTGLSLSAITSEASHAGKPKMVRARNAETGEEVSLGEFDTVMFAIGRQPLSPSRFGAQNAGVETAGGRVTGGHAWPGHKLCEISSHVPESSTCPGVFAVGDVLQGSSELTPVAIQQGVRVARLLNQAGWKYGASRATEDPASATAFSLDGLDLGGLGMEVEPSRRAPPSRPTPAPWQLAVPPPVDPTLVPTAVFTPAEYACVGLSEEEAIRQYGQDGVEVVWSKFDDLEARLASQHAWRPHSEPGSLAKVVARREEPWNVLGFHLVGPEASEAIQGFAMALRAGVTLPDVASCVGVHPTLSEELVSAHVTRRSGADPTKSSC
ncbi:hypothetical protein FNF27_06383 [Cafeteria roenbergensis]|uniref:FAD/NAD(P)-binding domain-containing protein n=1 Tax=Cafeteria roenbergensis TaxID=33653 RepID=A0A5A8E2S1_CAFRO|nr:hypothetical protein FNF27_06383 [Cafeteria roenbergensis]